MRGDKPKPTALKLIAGNPGKRALNAQEPQYPTGSVEAPDWLAGEARARWERLAPIVAANGLLTEASREVLAGYCDLVGRYIEKRRAGEEPDLKIIHQMRMLACEFGFTPSSATRIVAPKKPSDGETKARFFAA